MLQGIDKDYEDPEFRGGWRVRSWGLSRESCFKNFLPTRSFPMKKAHILSDQRPFVWEFSSPLGSKMNDVGGGRGQGRRRAEQTSEVNIMELTIAPCQSPGPFNSLLLTLSPRLFLTPTSPIHKCTLSASKEQEIFLDIFPLNNYLSFAYNQCLINICKMDKVGV